MSQEVTHVTSELGLQDWEENGGHAVPQVERLPVSIPLLVLCSPLFHLSHSFGAGIELWFFRPAGVWGRGDMANVQNSRLFSQSPACMGKTNCKTL